MSSLNPYHLIFTHRRRLGGVPSQKSSVNLVRSLTTIDGKWSAGTSLDGTMDSTRPLS